MRSWLVLVTVAVAAVAGFCVYRLDGIFAAPDNQWSSSGFSDDLVSFNPKHIALQVFGRPDRSQRSITLTSTLSHSLLTTPSCRGPTR
jgi:Mycobacterium membrane protein